MPKVFADATSAQLEPDDDQVTASNLRHRDGWVLYNALRIRSGVDPDGLAAERLALRSRIAYLQQLQGVTPVHTASREELVAAVTQLQADIADMDARLAQAPGAASEALAETTAAAQNIAKLLAATNDDVKAAAQAIINPAATAAPPVIPDKEAQARFDRRKAELVRALDAIIARPAADATQRDFKQRAESLKASVQKLTAPATTNDADAATLVNRLNSLDDVLATVQTIPDSGVRSEVAQIDLLRSYAQQGVAMGLSTSDFEVRRGELLNLLDLIERRGGPNVRLRLDPLRQRALLLRPGSPGDRELRRNRQAAQKQLDRVRLELELLSSPDQESASTQNDTVDQKTIQDTLTSLTAPVVGARERSPHGAGRTWRARRGERRAHGVAGPLHQVPRIRFVRRAARPGACGRTGNGAIGLRSQTARAGDEVRDLSRSAALDWHADPGGQVQARGAARGTGGQAVRCLVEPVRHRHELAGRGELPNVPQAVASEVHLCDVPRLSPVVSGEAAGGVAMSARLVGWMPHIGRLSAAVGASARLGATADNDVVVRVDGVSRSHALLVEQPDGYYIEDKGSSNGTWVNGERVKRARLRHLDVITLGRFAELVFVARETEVAAKGAPVPAPAAAMTAQLQWLDGPLAGQTINLPHGEIVIGRAETCGLVVDSDAVSRMHARMRVSDEGVTIEDLGTVNGTAVNGEALAAATPLESGAEVDIGQVRRFKLIVNRGAAASVPVVEEPDDFGSTRLVWSPKDLEMLEKARATRKSGTRPAVKPAAAAPLPLSGSKKAAAPAASPPPPPPQVAPPPAAAEPAVPAAVAPAAVQGGGESADSHRGPRWSAPTTQCWCRRHLARRHQRCSHPPAPPKTIAGRVTIRPLQ